MFHFQEQRKIQDEQISDNNKKKKNEEELNYMKLKKAFLKADITAMENSAEEQCTEGESTKSIYLFIKTNSVHKDIKEKNIRN